MTKIFFLWITTHIDLLKQKKWDLIDIEHLIEELDSIGKSEIRSLASLFGILFAHLYKWDHFPKSRSKSWINSIEYSQEEINRLLNKQPSLKSKLNEAIEDGWSYAKKNPHRRHKHRLSTSAQRMSLQLRRSNQ